MKKNMLKYCLMLLAASLFCVKAMSQDSFPMCVGGAVYEYILEGSEAPYGYTVDKNTVYYLMTIKPSYPCMMDEDMVGGMMTFWRVTPEEFPIGNGTFILMLFVLGYGGVLYYRHRRKSELV